MHVAPTMHAPLEQVNPEAQSVSSTQEDLHLLPSLVQIRLLQECAPPTTQSPLPLQLLSASTPDAHAELQMVVDVGKVHAWVLMPSHELAHAPVPLQAVRDP